MHLKEHLYERNTKQPGNQEMSQSCLSFITHSIVRIDLETLAFVVYKNYNIWISCLLLTSG